MKSSLFNIEARLLAVHELATTGEYDPDTIADTIEAIEWELDEKADNYAALIAQLDGEIATIDKEMERLKGLKAARTRLKDQLKTNLYSTMISLERPKFKTPLHSFYIQKNPPAVGIVNEAEIPAEYFTQPQPVINKSALLEVLKRGEIVPGATITQGESLRIR